VLDVEGTTSSIRFVYDEMFPYIRRNLSDYLSQHWDSVLASGVLPRLAAEIGMKSAESWLVHGSPQQSVADAVLQLMDRDAKTTGLKQIQGAIWRRGFETGELVAHLYNDVAEAMRNWRADGLGISIYSSGSVEAQRLFFGHSLDGNLLPLIDRHFDTTIGPKKDTASYQAIARELDSDPAVILFVSDVPAELDAATAAGWAAALCIRPGNAPVENPDDYIRICSFAELDLTRLGV
jgi:enolase-phosphatase E1